MINVNASKPRGAFRVFSIIFLAVFSLVSACAPRVAKFGAVVDNGGGVTLNSSGLHMNAKPITNMADGTASSDGAAFHQIADALNAKTYKGTVRARATGNIASLSGLALTVDTVAIDTVGYHVLVDQQTTTTQDACYVAQSGAWTLCPEMAVGTSASSATFTVMGGTQAGVWVDKQTATQTVGTNDLTFTQVASAGGGSIGGTLGAVANVVPMSSGTGGVTLQASPLVLTSGVASGITFNDPSGAQDPVTRNYFETQRFNPAASTRVFEDFANGANGTVSATVPTPGGFLADVNGTSSTVTILATANTATEHGIARAYAGTLANGNAAIYCGAGVPPAITGCGVTLPTANQTIFDIKFRIPQLSNGTETHTVRIGLMDATDSTTAPTNGVFLTENANADTHFILHALAGGTDTTTTTSVAVTAGQWYHAVATKTLGADTAAFKLDGVSLGSALSGIPTAVVLTLAARITKTAGTGANQAQLDADWLGYDDKNARAN